MSRIGVCSLISLLSLLWGPLRASAEPVDDMVAAATADLDAGQYDNARVRLAAAYKARQDANTLRLLAQAEAKLGHAAAAIEHYDRFLAAASDAEPEVITEVRQELVRLRASLPPLDKGYGERLRLRAAALDRDSELFVRRYKAGPSNGMLGTGLALLLTGTTAAWIGGGITLIEGGNDRAPVWGGLMFLPVLGPFLAPISGSGDLTWDVPWAILDGGAQLTGLILTIVGSRYKDKHPYLEQLRFTPIASATVQGVGVSGRF
jgi:hypothetical protein